MQLTTDIENNVGYIRLVAKAAVAYSVEFDDNLVADFDASDNLVGIELLDAKTYEPADLQKMMSKANAEALRQRGEGEPVTNAQRSA